MVVLGTTTMPIHQVMRLSRGAIIELDATEADEVKILANNLPIASGVVLVDRNRIAVEVKQMLPKSPGSGKGSPSPYHRAGLVPPSLICYIRAVDPVLIRSRSGRSQSGADLEKALVAELVDALP